MGNTSFHSVFWDGIERHGLHHLSYSSFASPTPERINPKQGYLARPFSSSKYLFCARASGIQNIILTPPSLTDTPLVKRATRAYIVHGPFPRRPDTSADITDLRRDI